MPTILKSELFWAAFGGIVALISLLWSPLGNLIPFFRNRRLQRTLIDERKFFEKNTPSKSQSDELTGYMNSIRNALQTIGNFGPEKASVVKGDLRLLIDQLRTTHQTLANSLMPFRSENAKAFFEDFDKTLQALETLWLTNGKYRHDVRTHCGDVEKIVNDIVPKLQPSGHVFDAQINQLQQIGWSMRSADTDVIVPVMDEVLSKTRTELRLINSAIREGSKIRAIRLKEKFRFDTDNLFQELNAALNAMNELETRL